MAESYAMSQSANGGNSVDYELAKQDFMAGWDASDNSRWISVEDALPEDGQRILEAYTLVAKADGLVTVTENVLVSRYKGKFVCNGKEENYGIGKTTSTTHHWMPIPEPPQKE